MVPSRPPNLQKTKEKLKNPQELDTQALESQEGLKQNWCMQCMQYTSCLFRLESQEGLKLVYRSRHDMEPVFLGPLESQEGLKLVVADAVASVAGV